MRFIAKKEYKIEGLCYEWLNFNKNIFKKSTFQTYKYLIEKHIIKSFLGEYTIIRLTANDIVCFSSLLLNKNLSPKTVNSILLILNSVFKYANKTYDIKTPTIQYVRSLRKEMRVLSLEEQNILEKQILSDMNNYNFGVYFALYTGVRIGELCALKWEDIEFGTVKIHKTMHRIINSVGKSEVFIGEPKTPSSNRTIPLPAFLVELTEEKRENNNQFILSSDKITIVEPRQMQKKFRSLTEQCLLDDVTFHTLRHTFATRCIECGFDAKTLSEILGHADVKTTMNRYVHSSMEFKRNNMNMLSQISTL